ncbi:MAG: DUF2807 domain-containing protein [Pedobacter sp.]|nr:MAG: DUF2807 domain-containing protein [Pedobacter sp.]
MKNILLFIISIFIFSSCSKERLTANGDTITETRTPGQFNELRTSGSSRVHIAYGNEYKVILKGSSNLLPYFKTTVNDGKLDLTYKNANVTLDDIEVFVTMPRIEEASLSGSGSIDIQSGFTNIDELDLAISGSGDISVNHELRIDELDIEISGSGKVFFSKAIARKAEIHISGSGDAHLQVTNHLKARISGSGQVYYKGDPQLDTQISGSGKLIKF